MPRAIEDAHLGRMSGRRWAASSPPYGWPWFSARVAFCCNGDTGEFDGLAGPLGAVFQAAVSFGAEMVRASVDMGLAAAGGLKLFAGLRLWG